VSDDPSEDPTRAIFHRDGDRLVPSTLARGPWYTGTQHGSAMLGLLARAVDRHPAQRTMQVVRLTADLSRAAPLAPVQTFARTVHSGRSVDTVEARIEADGETYARAVALRFRVEEIDVSGDRPEVPSGRHELPGADAALALPSAAGEEVEAFHSALEIRLPIGSEAPVLWLRLRFPFVAGEETSPLVKTAALADWTYSGPILRAIRADLANARRERGFTTINPDTSVNLHRPMAGDWLCLESQVQHAGIGAGTAVAQIYDAEGRIGHSSQSILVRSAEKRPLYQDEARQRRESGAS